MCGSFWSSQSKPRGPSQFLEELSADAVIGPLPVAPENDENPLGDEDDLVTWPFDPLGNRRARVEAAAQLVSEADPARESGWTPELDLLLAEREARLGESTRVPLPVRVPASRFKDFVTDPATVAASLRRPMPERPYRATRLGTLFHSWVEHRSGTAGSFEELDAPITERDGDDEPIDAKRLAELQATFEQSPWASLAPVEVEREIHLVLDGRIIICKIDAVYALPGGRFQVVDWKTGKAPRDAEDLDEKQLQLALYRLAFAQWKRIDPGLIDAVFYFVADDRVIAPDRLYSEAELIARWRSALG